MTLISTSRFAQTIVSGAGGGGVNFKRVAAKVVAEALSRLTEPASDASDVLVQGGTPAGTSASRHPVRVPVLAPGYWRSVGGPVSAFGRWRTIDPGFFEPVRQDRAVTSEPVCAAVCVVGDDPTGVLGLARLLFGLLNRRVSVVDTLAFLTVLVAWVLRTLVLHRSPPPVEPPGRLVTSARRAPRGPDRVQAPMVLPGCGQFTRA